MAPGAKPFWRMRSVVNATAIPARNRKSGAGSVPPSCDHFESADWCAAGLSQES